MSDRQRQSLQKLAARDQQEMATRKEGCESVLREYDESEEAMLDTAAAVERRIHGLFAEHHEYAQIMMLPKKNMCREFIKLETDREHIRISRLFQEETSPTQPEKIIIRIEDKLHGFVILYKLSESTCYKFKQIVKNDDRKRLNNGYVKPESLMGIAELVASAKPIAHFEE